MHQLVLLFLIIEAIHHIDHAPNVKFLVYDVKVVIFFRGIAHSLRTDEEYTTVLDEDHHKDGKSCDRTHEHGQPSPHVRDLSRGSKSPRVSKTSNLMFFCANFSKLGARYEGAYHSSYVNSRLLNFTRGTSADVGGATSRRLCLQGGSERGSYER